MYTCFVWVGGGGGGYASGVSLPGRCEMSERMLEDAGKVGLCMCGWEEDARLHDSAILENWSLVVGVIGELVAEWRGAAMAVPR